MINFFTTHWISIVGAIIGLIFLYLEYKASIWMWAASILMAVFYIALFYSTQLYANMGIYIYFFAASIYGWVIWLLKRKESNTNEDIILRAPTKSIIPICISVALISIIIYFILKQWTENTSTIMIGDALSTSLNIVALWMISRKWAEQWLLLVPANFISGLLLIIQDDYISGILFFIFFIVSILGYFKWKRLAKKNQLKNINNIE